MKKDEEREPLQPDLTNKDVKVINDLIEDLTKLDSREKIPLGRLHNNNNERHSALIHSGGQSRGLGSLPLTKRSSLLSSSSRGSVPDSVILETQNDRVSTPEPQWLHG